MTEAVKRMRGERGTDVSISILRPGKRYLIPMKITREIIKVQSVKYRELGSNIHYIRLSQLQDDSSKEFEEKLDLVSKDTNIKGYLLIVEIIFCMIRSIMCLIGYFINDIKIILYLTIVLIFIISFIKRDNKV